MGMEANVMDQSFELKNKPSFAEWDETTYILTRQLRLAARILDRKGFAERALQLRDQARQLDAIFFDTAESFEKLGKKADPEIVEAVENKAVARLMRILPGILEGMPLLAKQVAMATGSSISEGVFKGPATEFFLGPAGKPEEGIGDGSHH
jgi:hypothetical protein